MVNNNKVTTNKEVSPATTTITEEVTAYCVKCKAKHPIKEHENVTLKNGKPALKGKCKNCNTTVFKLTKKKV